MAVGRPTTYNKKLADYVCEIIATHRHGLKKLCLMYKDFPDHTTIALWRFKHKEFSTQYLNAKQAQMDLIMEELDDLMDESLGYYVDDKGNKKIDPPSASIAIAKVNNRKWFASKIAPKLYGDRQQIDIESTQFSQEVKDKMSSLTPIVNEHEKEY